MFDPVAVPITVSPESMSEALSSTTDAPPEGMVMDDSTMNHLTYKATNKVPYVIDYFGLKDFYGTNEDITGMAKELHEFVVDNETETQIHETKMKLDLLAQELNLQENDAPMYKLRKMLDMARIKGRMAKNEAFNLQMLADVQKM